MRRSTVVVDDFAPEALPMRRAFDERFSDPRAARGDRFVWDYWHVPGQYTLLRTPAYMYFARKLYARFHRRLVMWGREHLGCHDISPPWLSCYVDGCRQELHGDLPHGPFAFVFSLTNWTRREFTGGETLMMDERVLDFWRAFESGQALEERGILREIAPRFNRLLVFDPRVPHGVRRVEGTHDPRAGRLVVHGWFVQPRPYIEGPLRRPALASRIEEVTQAVTPWLEAGLTVQGVVVVRFGVTPAGVPHDVNALTDTTRSTPEHEGERRQMVRAALSAVRRMRLPRAAGESRITLPLVFER